MIRNCILFLALLGLSSISACTTFKPGADANTEIEQIPLAPPRKVFFPKDYSEEIWIDLARFGEPKLHLIETLERFNRRYRLSMSGVVCTEFVIRIDEKNNHRVSGLVKKYNRCNRSSRIERRYFSAKPYEIEGLQKEIDDAAIFKFYPEFWVSTDKDSICIDGIQLVMELLDATGHKISVSNTPCTAPAKVRAIASKFVEIADEKGTKRFLP